MDDVGNCSLDGDDGMNIVWPLRPERVLYGLEGGGVRGPGWGEAPRRSSPALGDADQCTPPVALTRGDFQTRPARAPVARTRAFLRAPPPPHPSTPPHDVVITRPPSQSLEAVWGPRSLSSRPPPPAHVWGRRSAERGRCAAAATGSCVDRGRSCQAGSPPATPARGEAVAVRGGGGGGQGLSGAAAASCGSGHYSGAVDPPSVCM